MTNRSVKLKHKIRVRVKLVSLLFWLVWGVLASVSADCYKRSPSSHLLGSWSHVSAWGTANGADLQFPRHAPCSPHAGILTFLTYNPLARTSMTRNLEGTSQEWPPFSKSLQLPIASSQLIFGFPLISFSYLTLYPPPPFSLSPSLLLPPSQSLLHSLLICSSLYASLALPLPAVFTNIISICRSGQTSYQGSSSFISRGIQEMSRSEERRVGKECRSRWWPDH